MQIEPNISASAVSRMTTAPAIPAKPAPVADSAVFDRTVALNQALKDQAGVRPEKVTMAQQLLGHVNWPPSQALQQIATLMAMHLDN